MNFIKGELIEIIEWTDDSRDTLSYRFPDDDKEIKRGAQLIVRESQVAQCVNLGQFGDQFGPGKYRLTTENIPVLSTLKGGKYGLPRVRHLRLPRRPSAEVSEEVAGTDHHFQLDEFAGVMRSRIVSVFSQAWQRAEYRPSRSPNAMRSSAMRCCR